MAETTFMGIEEGMGHWFRKNYLGFVIVGGLAVAGGGLTVANFKDKKAETPVVSLSQPALEERVTVPEQKPPEISPEAQPYFERAREYLKEKYGLSEKDITLFSYTKKNWQWPSLSQNEFFGYAFFMRSSSAYFGLGVDTQMVISEDFNYLPSTQEREVITALEQAVAKSLIVLQVKPIQVDDVNPLLRLDFPSPTSDQLYEIKSVRGRDFYEYYFDFPTRIIFGQSSPM